MCGRRRADPNGRPRNDLPRASRLRLLERRFRPARHVETKVPGGLVPGRRFEATALFRQSGYTWTDRSVLLNHHFRIIVGKRRISARTIKADQATAVYTSVWSLK